MDDEATARASTGGDTGPALPVHGLHDAEWLHHPACWGCGPRAQGGLGLRVEPDGAGGFRASFAVPHTMHGPPGRVHGGLLSVPMDCLASWAAIAHARRRAVAEGRDPDATVPLTGSYDVHLRGPVPTDVPLVVTAAVAREDGRKLFVHAELAREDEVLATFDSIFIEVPVAVAAPPD